jgi:hypothetical protein
MPSDEEREKKKRTDAWHGKKICQGHYEKCSTVDHGVDTVFGLNLKVCRSGSILEFMLCLMLAERLQVLDLITDEGNVDKYCGRGYHIGAPVCQ